MTLCSHLFHLLIAAMNDSQSPGRQCNAAETVSQSLAIFKRAFSFPHQSEKLIRSISGILSSCDGNFVIAAYSVLRRCIDYFYPYVPICMDAIGHPKLTALEPPSTIRQIEA
jgi:hypothetical protein